MTIKQIFLAITLCIVMGFAQAQTMKLTPNDFVDAADESKNYVVLNFPGKSQQELYKAVLKFANSVYNRPEKVITKVEGEQIVLDAMEKQVTSWGRLRKDLDFFYKITMDFKDGRMRFSPNYKYLEGYDGIEYPLVKKSNLWVKTAMFNTGGKVRREAAQQDLEKFINDFIVAIANSINSSKTNDNW
ncbi:DUF4468 domain-containing protein [Sphingobacterium sp. InxBP1]|uniref:DUF4468 domain-containing protein n=1 Tax=Sphingobacterium sp. InxBP1 TaxID=2870328 RepID=UPI0022448D34|nr:DUF4468 domain-containing protein [Sphingobacterium sp. InxBP1]MCW8310124.1 DUF4468 domain-containing protein [Sphingobacterium sp. InxBP1]